LFSIPAWKDPQCVPKAVGWEPKGGKLMPRFVSLAESMDPERYIVYLFLFVSIIILTFVTIPYVYCEGSASEVLLLGVAQLSLNLVPKFAFG
jgi:hypothetical protein